MKTKFSGIARILLGLVFFVFGLNKFFHFLPMSQEMPEKAGMFMGALMGAGYMFPLIAIVEILVGAALLLNRYVALALVLLAPVTVNIFLFHLFLDIKNIWMALLVIVLHLYLLIVHKEKYDAFLTAK